MSLSKTTQSKYALLWVGIQPKLHTFSHTHAHAHTRARTHAHTRTRARAARTYRRRALSLPLIGR